MASLLGAPDPPPVIKPDSTGRPRVFVPKKVEPAPPPPKPYSVETIRAAKRTEEIVADAKKDQSRQDESRKDEDKK
jgi:hypothetical protein